MKPFSGFVRPSRQFHSLSDHHTLHGNYIHPTALQTNWQEVTPLKPSTFSTRQTNNVHREMPHNEVTREAPLEQESWWRKHTPHPPPHNCSALQSPVNTSLSMNGFQNFQIHSHVSPIQSTVSIVPKSLALLCMAHSHFKVHNRFSHFRIVAPRPKTYK